MADPDQRRARLTAKPLHLEQDLCLDGDVQGRGGLVGNDQVGFVEQCDRNGHTLAHAARELVRVGRQALIGRGNAHAHQRGAAARAGSSARHRRVGLDGLDHLRVDAQHRVQRGHRVLEDHGDAAPAQGTPLLRAAAAQVLAVQQDAPAHLAPRRVYQPHERQARDGLARARFAHQPQHLAAPQLERHVLHRTQHPLEGGEVGAQALHLQQRDVGRAHRRSLGLRMSRNRSATRLMLRMVSSSASPG